MVAPIPLDGRRFGRLKVLRRHKESTPAGKARWICHCDCGKEAVVISPSLIAGRTRSCGCLHDEVSGARLRTHGMSKTQPEYSPWKAMRSRCGNKAHRSYHLYGGRGIRVCSRWGSFTKFLNDMGPRPTARHSIERKDPNGDYEPTNCYWATPVEQSRNRRWCKRYEYLGESLTLPEWCDRLQLDYRLMYSRLSIHGWPFEMAVSAPRFTKYRRKRARP